MLYHLYRRSLTPLLTPELPPDLRVEVWRPTLRRPVHGRLPAVPFLAWSLFHFLRVFRNRDYTLVLLFREDRLVHRTCLFPAHFRFPFMAAEDLQAGGLWTAPEARGQGLAYLALGLALARRSAPRRTLWYMAKEDNLPSIRLAEKAAFSRHGQVVRMKGPGARFLALSDLQDPNLLSKSSAGRPRG